MLIKYSVLTASLLLVSLAASSTENTTQAVKNRPPEISSPMDTEMSHTSTTLNDGRSELKIILKNGDKAYINANGDLRINQKNIVLNDNQRVLTQRYYASLKSMTSHGLHVGKESIKLATQAVGMAIGNIFSSTSDEEFDKKLEAKSGKLEHAVQELCDNATEIKILQEQLAIAIPEFIPEPMQVTYEKNGCQVNSGTNVNVDMNSNNKSAAQ